MKKRGFTLLEVLIVIVIISILTILTLPKILKTFRSATQDIFESEIKNIYNIARGEYVKDAFNNPGRKVFCNTGDCDGNELTITGGGKTKYSIKLNDKGDVLCFQATNGSFYYVSQGKLDDVLSINYIHQSDEKTVNFTPDCTYSVDYREVKRINVINIYPDRTTGSYPVKYQHVSDDRCESYKNYQSSSLKGWMEDPTSESYNGFGKGIIKVIPVSFTEFNAHPDPDYWVQDFYDSGCMDETEEELANANFNRSTADLMFIGIWDANANTPYSTAAIDAIVNWTQSGKPIIGGHDTIIFSETECKKLATRVKDNFGLDISGGNSARYDRVFILTEKKKNVFTLWPWTITNKGKNGKDGLTIPKTHATGQYVVKGDVWVALGGQISETTAKNNRFYLATNDNTAIIQTGDQNCTSTEDEQKMIANTIFFMFYKFVLHENGDDMDLIE